MTIFIASKFGVGGGGEMKYSLIGEYSPAMIDPLLARTLNLYCLREVKVNVVVKKFPFAPIYQFSMFETPSPSIRS